VDEIETTLGVTGPIPVNQHWGCVSEAEHKRLVQEAFDAGYNAGKADTYMDEAYAEGDPYAPDRGHEG
jgi:hypothetical protein